MHGFARHSSDPSMQRVVLFILIFLSSPLFADPDYRIQPGSALTTATAGYRHQRFTVQATIENLGDGGTAGLRVRFRFISLSDPSDTYLARNVTATGTVQDGGSPIINYGSNPTFQLELMPNATMPPGNYRLQAWIDPEAEDTDSNRLNNLTDLIPSFTLHPSPDLRARLLYPDGDSASYQAGDTITFELGLQNIGDPAEIAASTMDFYLFRTEILSRPGVGDRWGIIRNDPDTVFLGSRVTRTISASQQQSFPGAWFTQDITFPFPGDLDFIEWGVIAHYNPNGHVPEPPDLYDDRFDSWGGNYVRTPPHVDLTASYVVTRPDFDPEFLSPDFSPRTVHAGGNVTVNARVWNRSPYPSTSSSIVEFELFAGYLNTRVPLGNRPLSALPGNLISTYAASYSETFRVPVDTPPGIYQIIVRADPIDVVPERNEHPNGLSSGTSKIEVLAPIAPNLIRNGDVDVTPSTASPGDPITLTLPVRNLGSGAAGAFDTRFYAGDTYLGTVRSTTTLAPGAPTTLTLATQVPPSMLAGQYSIQVEIDAADEIEETVEQGREYVFGDRLNVVPPGPPTFPDLVMDQLVTIESSGKFNTEGLLTFQFINQGDAAATACDFRLYLSPDPEAGGNDILLNSGGLPALSPGEKDGAGIDFLLPEEGATGPYWFVVELDSGAAVTESDELNNTHVFTADPLGLSSEGLPEVQLASRGRSPDSLLAGDDILQFFSIENSGPGDVGGIVTEVRLSPDPVPGNGNDILLKRYGPTLLPEGSETDFSDYLQIPVGTPPGEYHLLWWVDPENIVPHAGGEPLLESRSITIRERRLRAEVVERTKTHDVIAIYDSWPDYEYLLLWGSEPDDLDKETERQPGKLRFPLLFEVENSGGEVPRRFFRAVEDE